MGEQILPSRGKFYLPGAPFTSMILRGGSGPHDEK
jgi:hypothetical protein